MILFVFKLSFSFLYRYNKHLFKALSSFVFVLAAGGVGDRAHISTPAEAGPECELQAEGASETPRPSVLPPWCQTTLST